MSQQTRIMRFLVEPLGGGPLFLYANGRQQLPVLASIQVETRESDLDVWQRRPLTESERQTLTLLDIGEQTTVPPDGWAVTMIKGEFDPGPTQAPVQHHLPRADGMHGAPVLPLSPRPDFTAALADDVMLYLSTTVVQHRRFIVAIEIDGIGLVTSNMNLNGVILSSFFDILSTAPRRIHARELTRQVDHVLPLSNNGWRAAQQFSFNFPQSVDFAQEVISGGIVPFPDGVSHHQILRQGNQFYGVLPSLLDERIDELTPMQITGRLPDDRNPDDREIPIRFSGSGLIRVYRFVDGAAWETLTTEALCVVSLIDRAGNESVFEVFANPANNEVYIRDRIPFDGAHAEIGVPRENRGHPGG